MRPHTRRFRTLLWEGLKENWWFEPRPVEFERVPLPDISGQSEYSWRQHSVTVPVPEPWMNDTDEIRNHAAKLIAEGYAEWSDEHHRLSSEVNNGGFFTVDEDDLEHLEHHEDQPELESDHRISGGGTDIDATVDSDKV